MWGPDGFNGVPSRPDEGVSRSLMAGFGYHAPGARFVLLDSVRDAPFLSTNGIDAGLGLVDDPKFVRSTRYLPGTPATNRPYPTKFFWLGSPAGTTDLTDTFSLFVADVVPGEYYAGAPASQWLTNPRKVIDVTQATSDVIKWFDANYPGGGTGGVGNTGTGTNTAYGTLDGNNANPGDVSAMASIDGQHWEVYDYVDNTWLLYFSIKTPNINTASIYCYKHTDSELTTPVTAAMFQGALGPAGWFGAPPVPFGTATVYSSHRFVVGPDPMNFYGSSSTQLRAVMLYAYRGFDETSPDHGAFLAGCVVQDIHGLPVAPTTGTSWPGLTYPFQLDEHYPPVDKFGSIHSVPSDSGSMGDGYVFFFNAPPTRDVRAANNTLQIGAMRVFAGFFSPVTNKSAMFALAVPSVLSPDGSYSAGYCRPQYTLLPDGVPKMLFANWTADQNMNLGLAYVSPEILSPKHYARLMIPAADLSGSSLTSGQSFPTWGKRYGWASFDGNPSINSMLQFTTYDRAEPGTTSGYDAATGRSAFAHPVSPVAANGLFSGLTHLGASYALRGLLQYVMLDTVGGPGANLLRIEFTDDDPYDPTSVLGYVAVQGKPMSLYASAVAPGGYGSFSSDVTSDPIFTEDFSEISITIKVGSAGTSLTINLLIHNLTEGTIAGPAVTLVATPTALTATAEVVITITHGVATAWVNGTATALGNIGALPGVLQVQFIPVGTWQVAAQYVLRKG